MKKNNLDQVDTVKEVQVVDHGAIAANVLTVTGTFSLSFLS
jgi:hypothetical protein